MLAGLYGVLGLGTDPTDTHHHVARSFNAAAATVTVGLIYLIGRIAGGPGTGLLAAAFVAFTSLNVRSSHFATVDTPATLWCVLAAYAGFRMLKAEHFSRGWCAIASLAAGLAAGTKYPAGIAVVFPLVALVARRERLGTLWRSVLSIGALSLVAFLASSPYVVLDFDTFLTDFREELRHARVGHFGFDTAPPGLVYTRGLYHLLAGLPFSMGLPLYLAALWGIVSSLRRRDAADAMLLAFVFSYYLISGFSKVVKLNYLLPLTPFLALLAARACMDAVRGGAGRRKLAAAAATGIVLLYTLALSAGRPSGSSRTTPGPAPRPS